VPESRSTGMERDDGLTSEPDVGALFFEETTSGSEVDMMSEMAVYGLLILNQELRKMQSRVARGGRRTLLGGFRDRPDTSGNPQA